MADLPPAAGVGDLCVIEEPGRTRETEVWSRCASGRDAVRILP